MANTGFNSDQYTDRALRQRELEELRLMLYICLVLQHNRAPLHSLQKNQNHLRHIIVI